MSRDSEPAVPRPSTSPRLRNQEEAVMMDTCRSSSRSKEFIYTLGCVCVCGGGGQPAMFCKVSIPNMEQMLNVDLQRSREYTLGPGWSYRFFLNSFLWTLIPLMLYLWKNQSECKARTASRGSCPDRNNSVGG